VAKSRSPRWRRSSWLRTEHEVKGTWAAEKSSSRPERAESEEAGNGSGGVITSGNGLAEAEVAGWKVVTFLGPAQGGDSGPIAAGADLSGAVGKGLMQLMGEWVTVVWGEAREYGKGTGIGCEGGGLKGAYGEGVPPLVRMA